MNDTRKPFRKLSLHCINHRTQTRSRVNFKPWHSNLCSKFCAIHCRGLNAGCCIASADLKECSGLQFWIVWLAHSMWCHFSSQKTKVAPHFLHQAKLPIKTTFSYLSRLVFDDLAHNDKLGKLDWSPLKHHSTSSVLLILYWNGSKLVFSMKPSAGLSESKPSLGPQLPHSVLCPKCLLFSGL